MKNLVKLGTLTSIRTGKLDANASSENGKYPFFTCSKEPLRIDSYSYNCECVLVAGNGDLNVKYYDGKFDAYQRTYIIESTDKSKLLVKYLYFFLDIYVEVLRTQSIGGVIKYIKLGNLTDAMIPLPCIEEQEVIVDRLEKCNDLLNRRIRQLAILDQLVKSRFVELFADCDNLVPMNDLCSIITDGTHQPPKFQETGIPFIFVSNLANNTVTYNAEKFISEETYAELYKRTPIEIGDILLSTVGSYGHPAVVLEDKKFLFQRHIAYLKPKRDVVNSFYLHSALLAPNGQRQIEEKVKGIAQKTLNLSEIRKIMIPIPGIDEQNEFEQFVKQVDKSKYYSQKFLTLCRLAVNTYEQEWMKCQTLNF